MLEKIEGLMQEGKWEEASFACDVRLQIHPNIGRLHAYKGLCFYRRGEYELAEVSFLRAYVLDPQLVEAAVKRVQCLEKLRRFKEAMDVVKEWLPHCPNDHTLLGLQEYLKMQYEAEEHDAWEKTRHVALNIEITHLDS